MSKMKKDFQKKAASCGLRGYTFGGLLTADEYKDDSQKGLDLRLASMKRANGTAEQPTMTAADPQQQKPAPLPFGADPTGTMPGQAGFGQVTSIDSTGTREGQHGFNPDLVPKQSSQFAGGPGMMGGGGSVGGMQTKISANLTPQYPMFQPIIGDGISSRRSNRKVYGASNGLLNMFSGKKKPANGELPSDAWARQQAELVTAGRPPAATSAANSAPVAAEPKTEPKGLRGIVEERHKMLQGFEGGGTVFGGYMDDDYMRRTHGDIAANQSLRTGGCHNPDGTPLRLGEGGPPKCPGAKNHQYEPGFSTTGYTSGGVPHVDANQIIRDAAAPEGVDKTPAKVVGHDGRMTDIAVEEGEMVVNEEQQEALSKLVKKETGKSLPAFLKTKTGHFGPTLRNGVPGATGGFVNDFGDLIDDGRFKNELQSNIRNIQRLRAEQAAMNTPPTGEVVHMGGGRQGTLGDKWRLANPDIDFGKAAKRAGTAVKNSPTLKLGAKGLRGAGKAVPYVGGAMDASMMADVVTDPNMGGMDVVEEGARNLGRWGSALALGKAGATGGALFGGMTGPLAPVAVPALSILGGLGMGAAGYFGADKLMDMGSGHSSPSQRSYGAVKQALGMDDPNNPGAVKETPFKKLTDEQYAAVTAEPSAKELQAFHGDTLKREAEAAAAREGLRKQGWGDNTAAYFKQNGIDQWTNRAGKRDGVPVSELPTEGPAAGLRVIATPSGNVYAGRDKSGQLHVTAGLDRTTGENEALREKEATRMTTQLKADSRASTKRGIERDLAADITDPAVKEAALMRQALMDKEINQEIQQDQNDRLERHSLRQLEGDLAKAGAMNSYRKSADARAERDALDKDVEQTRKMFEPMFQTEIMDADGKPSGKFGFDNEAYSRFEQDIAGRGGNLYTMRPQEKMALMREYLASRRMTDRVGKKMDAESSGWFGTKDYTRPVDALTREDVSGLRDMSWSDIMEPGVGAGDVWNSWFKNGDYDRTVLVRTPGSKKGEGVRVPLSTLSRLPDGTVDPRFAETFGKHNIE